MPEITTADACARYLQLLGGSARLIAAPFGLRPDAEAGLAGFVDAASGFLASAQAQLGQIGLAHRFHFGLIDNATTAEQLGGASQDAYAGTDPFARRGETRASFVLFTLPFARDILLAWEVLLCMRPGIPS